MDVPPRGMSVDVYMPTGDPNAFRIYKRRNHVMRGVYVRRSMLSRIAERHELGQGGVAVLLGEDDCGQMRVVRITESLNLWESQEDWRRRVKDDSWLITACFSMQGFTRPQTRWLAYLLAEMAKKSPKHTLVDNVKDYQPEISELQRCMAEECMDDIELMLPLMGISLMDAKKGEDRESIACGGPDSVLS